MTPNPLYLMDMLDAALSSALNPPNADVASLGYCRRLLAQIREGVIRRAQQQEEGGAPYDHPEHGLTCPIGGCALRVSEGDEGTCCYVPIQQEAK